MAMKALFLEGIHEDAVANFSRAGYEVRTLPGSPDGALLVQEIRDVSVLGIRSKTRITKAVLESASELLVVGAYCIGVEQIDCASCTEQGIAVFNDPHSNTRSVAELALGEIIMLVRRVFHSSLALHCGDWHKSAKGCHEVRGLTLGIVGYGKIGSQLSDLAEAIGMKVVFCDVTEVLARGNAKNCTFSELLQTADVVSLHVDGKPQNRNFFGEEEFRSMKRGSCFLNLSRGFVVNHEALAENLKSGEYNTRRVACQEKNERVPKFSLTDEKQAMQTYISGRKPVSLCNNSLVSQRNTGAAGRSSETKFTFGFLDQVPLFLIAMTGQPKGKHVQ